MIIVKTKNKYYCISLNMSIKDVEDFLSSLPEYEIVEIRR